MKFRRFAAALLMAALCLIACLPTGFAAGYTATLGLEVQVQCTGSSIPTETFALELTAKGNAPMPAHTASGEAAVVTVANDGDKVVTAIFPEITFTQPGYYYYTLKQAEGTSANGTYDSTVYYLKVKVVNSGDALRTDVMAFTSSDMPADAKQSEILFVNHYASDDPNIPPYTPPEDDNTIPDTPYTPTVPVTPPAPETPTNPPVQDATPVVPGTPATTPADPAAPTPAVPDPATPTTVVADAKPDQNRLIQTGQTNWPVPVLAGSGIVLIGVGILLTHHDNKRKDENA